MILRRICTLVVYERKTGPGGRRKQGREKTSEAWRGWKEVLGASEAESEQRERES